MWCSAVIRTAWHVRPEAEGQAYARVARSPAASRKQDPETLLLKQGEGEGDPGLSKLWQAEEVLFLSSNQI